MRQKTVKGEKKAIKEVKVINSTVILVDMTDTTAVA